MAFKLEYARAVGLTPATYEDEASAVVRIRQIYVTARTGRIDTWLASELWHRFFAVWRLDLGAIPLTADAFDDLAIRRIESIAIVLHTCNRGGLGHGQKMVNLFLKDQWALGAIPERAELLLHLPLDRTVLSRLKKIPEPWSAWTRVGVERHSGRYDVVAAYLAIQRAFRDRWAALYPRFASPIEMEQFLWGTVDVPIATA